MTIASGRKRLRSLSRVFLNDYYSNFAKLDFDDYLKGLLWMFAVAMLAKTLNRGLNKSVCDLDSFFANESNLLSRKFPSLHKSYVLLNDVLPTEIRHSYLRSVEVLCSQESNIDGMLSWLYQYLKGDREREAFSKSLNNHEKISGSDLLHTTQFFTEKYMTDYIVRNTFKTINLENVTLDNLRVIDPACGGGNFLLSAFDHLFEYYVRHNGRSISEIVNCLLGKTLVGYDLDTTLANVGKLNLYIKACKYIERDDLTVPRLYGGLPNDQLGFLRKSELNPLKVQMVDPDVNSRINFSDVVGTIPYRVFMTNPPFMGIRNMAIDLKEYLQANYPLSNGDLCVSFMYRCLELLREKEKLGLVNQTSWMYLKTFKGIRRYIIDNYFIEQCVDLGNNSFIDLGGEKSNVALTILAKGVVRSESKFYYLRSLPFEMKKNSLEKSEIRPDSNLFQSEFLKNINYEINYILSDSFGSKLNELPKYGEYANPMQGTSTGNNSEFIDYAWNRVNDPDWRLVSKGGGYCKWRGLNIYKVKWGNDAEHIRNNPGSALRNLDKIESTQLVYSDTGTLGMNVRVRLESQIFIASGPGIQVIGGDPFSHMAYLNSRVATFFMKMLSPKLTISAGYISGLPIKEGLLFSDVLSNLAKKCVNFKEATLALKIGNQEFSHLNYKTITHIEEHLEWEILLDLKNELERLRAEAQIEEHIMTEFDFSENQISMIRRIVGSCAGLNSRNNIVISPDELDYLLSTSLDINCKHSTSFSKKQQLGNEGFLETISLIYKTSPDVIFEMISKSIGDMKLTKKKYLEDLLHKLALFVLGFRNNNSRAQISLGIGGVVEEINGLVPDINKQIRAWGNEITLENWLSHRLKKHHSAAFKGSPIMIFEESKSDSVKSIKTN